ncbi:MAG TPA: tRNA uridine-5-carboxymethylaminomethyl(34) synthesis GTPase MnmE, partial [Nitrospiria bacterium]
RIVDPATGEPLDEAMVSVQRAPRTYTRENTVEVYCHGGSLLLRRVTALFLRLGARPADPGEFTRRAFLNGRISLSQAEAVLDLIRAKTEAAQRAAMAQLDGGLHQAVVRLRGQAVRLLAEIEAGIDFVEEDIVFLSEDRQRTAVEGLMDQADALLKTARGGRVLREGVATAIIGRPNVGKSSLLNALLRQNRAIVTPIPGTTRDVIEEVLNLDGLPLRIMDTAGLRNAEDAVEREGISRAYRAMEQADLILIVLDAEQAVKGLTRDEIDFIRKAENKPQVLILNKLDLLPAGWKQSAAIKSIQNALPISALTGEGLERLRAEIASLIRSGIVSCGEQEAMINERHQSALLRAREAFFQVAGSIGKGVGPEVVAADLRSAIDRLGELTGDATTEDLLDSIFRDFCIGK